MNLLFHFVCGDIRLWGCGGNCVPIISHGGKKYVSIVCNVGRGCPFFGICGDIRLRPHCDTLLFWRVCLLIDCRVVMGNFVVFWKHHTATRAFFEFKWHSSVGWVGARHTYPGHVVAVYFWKRLCLLVDCRLFMECFVMGQQNKCDTFFFWGD